MPREGWNELQEAAWGGNLQKITQIIDSYAKKSDPSRQSAKQSLEDGQSLRNNSENDKNYADEQNYSAQEHSNMYSPNLSGNNNTIVSNNNLRSSNQQILNELTSSSSDVQGYLDGGETIYSVPDKKSHHEDEQENLRLLLNTQTPNAQETALHLVCHNKFCNVSTGIRIMDLLLLHGAHIEARNSFGQTPLFVTAQQGQLEFTQFLIEKGANKEAAEKEQATPLYIACEQGHIDVVKYLVQKGANVNATELNGATALFIAAQKGFTQIVSELLKCGADPNIQANDGTTVLHVAVDKVVKEAIKELLKTPLINTNLVTKRTGKTPLHIAAIRGSEEVTKWLLQKGSNPNALTKDGKKPYELASRASVQKLLLDAATGKVQQPSLVPPSSPSPSPSPLVSPVTSPAQKSTLAPAVTVQQYNFTPSSPLQQPQTFQLFTPTPSPQPVSVPSEEMEDATLNSGYLDTEQNYTQVPMQMAMNSYLEDQHGTSNKKNYYDDS